MISLSYGETVLVSMQQFPPSFENEMNRSEPDITKEKNALALLNQIIDSQNNHGGLSNQLTELKVLLLGEKAMLPEEPPYQQIFQYFNYAPFGAFIADESGKCLHVNKAAKDQFGCTEVMFDAKCIRDFLVADDSFVGKRFTRLFREEGYSDEFLMKNLEGKEFYTLFSSKRISENAFLVFTTDVDKQKTMEKTLEDSQTKYKAFSEIANEAIFITEKGYCIECNETASKMFGYSHDEFIGEYATFIAAPEYVETIASNIQSGNEEPYEVLLMHKNGTKFWGETHGSNYHYKGRDVRVASVRNISQRKKYEEDLKQTITDLQESESKIRALSDTSNEAIFFSNKGKYVECNQAACKMFGYQYDELIGLFGTDVTAPEEREMVNSRMLSGYEKPYEATALRKDGSTFFAEFHGKMYDYQGEKVRITTVRDVTAQKQTEQELKETEEKLRLFAENTNDIIWTTDNNFCLVYVSPSVEKSLGYLPESLIGASFLDLLTEKSQSTVKKALENFRESLFAGNSENRPKNIELQINHKNGSIVWVELQANVVLDTQQNFKFFTGVSRDITQWKEDEVQLRQAADIMENIQSGIHLYHMEDIDDDTSFRLIAANPATEKLIGVQTHKIVGKTMDENFPDLRSMGIPQKYAEVVRTKIPLAIDTIEYKDTKIGSLNVSLKAFPLPNNCLGVSFESLTELKKTQSELEIRNHELNNFVYKVSHDLRAPLASIKGLIHLAKYEKGPDEYLMRIDNSIQKLDDFIRNVLSHSRNLNTSPIVDKIDFKVLINHCLTELNYLPGVKRLQKEVKVKGQDFYNDSVRIFEIFRNMISNAIKYQDLLKDDSILKIEVDISQNFARIEIEDNGLGIEDEHLSNIYSMFYRASEKSDGSGIGLYIVHQAIQKLEGTIEVKSELKVGTKFTIEIPNLIDKKQFHA